VEMKRLVLTHDKFRKDMESREMDTQKEMANVQLSLAELDKKRKAVWRDEKRVGTAAKLRASHKHAALKWQVELEKVSTQLKRAQERLLRERQDWLDFADENKVGEAGSLDEESNDKVDEEKELKDADDEEYVGPGSAYREADLAKAVAQWTADGVKGWGTKGNRYPSEIILLYLSLATEGATASKASAYVLETLRAFRSDLAELIDNETITLPSEATVGRWRGSLQILADITAAVKLSTATHVTLHADGTTLAQLKLALCVFGIDGGEYDGESVITGGVHAPLSGKSNDALESLFKKAFDGVDEITAEARKYIENKLNRKSSILPRATDGTLSEKVRTTLIHLITPNDATEPENPDNPTNPNNPNNPNSLNCPDDL
jgi:hypothetical protein